jgi:hypothetical protein
MGKALAALVVPRAGLRPAGIAVLAMSYREDALSAGRPVVVYGDVVPTGPFPDNRPDVIDDSRPPTGRGLRVALAAACVAVVVLAAYIWVDHHRSDAERAAVAAVAAYLEAWNAHDAAAVREAMAPRGGFLAGESFHRPIVDAPVGPALDDLLDAVFAAKVSFETPGRIEVLGGDAQHLSARQRVHYRVYGVDVVEEGVSLFTLVEVDGVPKVAEHMWWRPYPARAPSMLWTR